MWFDFIFNCVTCAGEEQPQPQVPHRRLPPRAVAAVAATTSKAVVEAEAAKADVLPLQ